MPRTAQKPEHTRLYLATQQCRHYRYQAAWSWPCPSNGSCTRVWREMESNGLQWTRWTQLNLVWPRTKHLYSAKWPLRLVDCWNSDAPRRAVTWKHNTYNQYKQYNTKCNNNLALPAALAIFWQDSYYCLLVSNKSQQTPWGRTWPLGHQHNEQFHSNGADSCTNDYQINKNIA